MVSQDHGIHSCEECVLEGSDHFQQEHTQEEEAQLIVRDGKIKLSPSKEDPSSDEEYEELNS